MARFTNPNPTTVNPKLPNSVVHDVEVLNRSIGISLNLMTRIVLRETLANPARRDEIIAEIARERSCRFRRYRRCNKHCFPIGATGLPGLWRCYKLFRPYKER